VTGWFTLLNYGYITENAIGTQWMSFPSPGFKSEFTPAEPKDWSLWFTRAIDYRDSLETSDDA